MPQWEYTKIDLNQIDTVVVDPALDEEHRRQVRDAGCELIVAEM